MNSLGDALNTIDRLAYENAALRKHRFEFAKMVIAYTNDLDTGLMPLVMAAEKIIDDYEEVK